MKGPTTLLIILLFFFQSVSAGLLVSRSNGIALTGADGIQFVDLSGISLTGADGLDIFRSNGIALTGADGLPITGSDGIALTGADGVSYLGPNGISILSADGIALTGADGIALTGADGITLTGADGRTFVADSIIVQWPDGITLTGADGIVLTGADGVNLIGPTGIIHTGPTGITLTGADGITLTGADGITLTGADGISLTGADSIIGIGPNGIVFQHNNPTGITLTGADGITLTGADGGTISLPVGIRLWGIVTPLTETLNTGLQGIDSALALTLDRLTDDSNVNAVVIFHDELTEADLNILRSLGILGGTRFRHLPMVYVTATKRQLIAVSNLSRVRSIYGNRTLDLNIDPYFGPTRADKVPQDTDLRYANNSLPVTGRNVGVAVLDTGINSLHPDMAGKVAANVKLLDLQSVPLGFPYPIPIEGLPTTDLVAGHGTFVGSIIAGSGAASNGKYAGVAPGARLIGLSAGDVSLIHVLSGMDYILEKQQQHNIRVVNCSFSANTPFDLQDPVNIATKMLTDNGISVVFSAGNSGPGNGTLNPYAAAPWVISVGATDHKGNLAGFSSRGVFGSEYQNPTVVAPGVNVAGVRSLASLTSVGGLLGSDLSRLSLFEIPFYTTASGTSFSAPQVAGAIALMLEANPNLTPAEIKEIIARTATPLPSYFYHEVGAGMLNTHAAVLAARFPERRIGQFRSAISSNPISFATTNSGPIDTMVYPGSTSHTPFTLPANTVQATFTSTWGLGINDFTLTVRNGSNSVVGSSNILNLPVLTGLREKVVLRRPAAGNYKVQLRHSLNLGLAQNVVNRAEITRVEMPQLVDISSISGSARDQAQQSLMMNILLPEGRRFRPDSNISRVELASALLRAGTIPQYVAWQPMFTDVRTAVERNAVESAQAAQHRLFYDATPGGRFNPYNNTTKLAAAIAYVRAAGLENSTSSALLPLTVLDRFSIPAQWRGHVAIALNRGFISMDGLRFNPGHPVTRIEAATSLNKVIQH